MHTVPQKASVVAGFVVLGLSPSFLDWQQSPDKRNQMIAFYVVGIGLIAFGIWDM